MGEGIFFMGLSLDKTYEIETSEQSEHSQVFAFNRSLIFSIAQLKNSAKQLKNEKQMGKIGELKNSNSSSSSNNQLQQRQQQEEEQKAQKTDNAANWQRNEEKTERDNRMLGNETLKRDAQSFYRVQSGG